MCIIICIPDLGFSSYFILCDWLPIYYMLIVYTLRPLKFSLSETLQYWRNIAAPFKMRTATRSLIYPHQGDEYIVEKNDCIYICIPRTISRLKNVFRWKTTHPYIIVYILNMKMTYSFSTCFRQDCFIYLLWTRVVYQISSPQERNKTTPGHALLFRYADYEKPEEKYYTSFVASTTPTPRERNDTTSDLHWRALFCWQLRRHKTRS